LNGVIIVDHFFTDPKKGFKEFKWKELVESEKITLNSGMLYEF